MSDDFSDEVMLLKDFDWAWFELSPGGFPGRHIGLFPVSYAIDGAKDGFGDFIGVAPLGLRDRSGAPITVMIKREDFE